MADGDEKIDHNDRVSLLNRLTDGKHEGVFNGATITWEPRQTRSIQRMEAEHFIRQSRVIEDPTRQTPGVYKLVQVDQAGDVIDDGTVLEPTNTPLTVAQCRELAKHGFLDTTHLAPDRQFGGDGSMQLIDPESGQHPQGRALRGGVKEGPIPAAPARSLAPAVSDRDLAPVAP